MFRRRLRTVFFQGISAAAEFGEESCLSEDQSNLIGINSFEGVGTSGPWSQRPRDISSSYKSRS